MAAKETAGEQPIISIIVPARNEEACLRSCLESLAAQAGVASEIVVVDDHSTDGTPEIARSFPNVRLVEAGPLPAGWTGKNNAVATGARAARGQWLLFTDADTVHLPGSLAAALEEAQENGVDLLSYSPEQIAVTFWEMATLPVVFAELARQYPPAKVSDPSSSTAAANGQYILVKREAYDKVGGHAAIAADILEDVALARAVKLSGGKIRFRYAGDRVRTRMYRSFQQLREGWTKNLALLFPNPGWLAAKTLAMWAFPLVLLLLPLAALLGAQATDHIPSLTKLHHQLIALSRVVDHWWWVTIVAMSLGRNSTRLRRANFDLTMEFLGALFGMPMFAYLLLRSKRMHGKGKIPWKGRTYEGKNQPTTKNAQQTLIRAKRLS